MTASILTNTSAMIALQTLRQTNGGLEELNNQISTGKEVASAKDNASLFAIAKVMESDVAGFQAVSDSLDLGRSTVAVASNAANSIGELLNEIKGKIIAANEDNVDRTKLQSEIVSLRGQITSIVSSAQFNGLNLIDGTNDGAGGFSVLASLDRDSAGGVTTSNISFDPTNTNLSTASGTLLTVTGGDFSAGTAVAGSSYVVGNGAGTPAAPAGGDFDLTTGAGTLRGTGGNDAVLGFGNYDFQVAATTTGGTTALDPVTEKTVAADLASGAGLLAGDVFQVVVDGISARYTVQAGDDESVINVSLRNELLANGLDTDRVSIDLADGIEFTNNTTEDISIAFTSRRASGGLAGLDTIDVSDAAGAAAATNAIEGFIQNAVDAQAQLGTTEKRLEIQDDFLSSLIDSFKSGIGSLVDADLEAASARLQALQAQQQLGIQALSIANQQPQNLLALFR
ncbi:flagellin [Paralimibaculum aggregatum]|uniref:Flagellin n=1 Tax=Paralimibaculum aggregatum TaxID=3036245 RepID=A0ABQ6LQV6_9RHOB|nr:flagellin [Limibaculum sp. NKW23]GMG83633.1 flagellin [Limibaculum sp. NKW23]